MHGLLLPNLQQGLPKAALIPGASTSEALAMHQCSLKNSLSLMPCMSSLLQVPMERQPSWLVGSRELAIAV
jgi:hypothetical protein